MLLAVLQGELGHFAYNSHFYYNFIMARGRGRPPRNTTEDRTVNAISRLRAFEAFEDSVPLKSLREDLKKGLTSAQLRKKYDHLVTARQITIALTEPASVANVAAKDLRDREEGKPVEKKELTHKLGNLSDEEIDAYLLTKLKDRNMLTDGTEDETTEDE
jgi:hypothetical protein